MRESSLLLLGVGGQEKRVPVKERCFKPSTSTRPSSAVLSGQRKSDLGELTRERVRHSHSSLTCTVLLDFFLTSKVLLLTSISWFFSHSSFWVIIPWMLLLYRLRIEVLTQACYEGAALPFSLGCWNHCRTLTGLSKSKGWRNSHSLGMESFWTKNEWENIPWRTALVPCLRLGCHVQDSHYSSAWVILWWCNRFHLKISEYFLAPQKSLIGSLHCISQFSRGLDVVLRNSNNLLVTEFGTKTNCTSQLPPSTATHGFPQLALDLAVWQQGPLYSTMLLLEGQLPALRHLRPQRTWTAEAAFDVLQAGFGQDLLRHSGLFGPSCFRVFSCFLRSHDIPLTVGQYRASWCFTYAEEEHLFCILCREGSQMSESTVVAQWSCLGTR